MNSNFCIHMNNCSQLFFSYLYTSGVTTTTSVRSSYFLHAGEVMESLAIVYVQIFK